MKNFDKWPNAKVVMEHMDNLMWLIGYRPNNGKGWTGYYYDGIIKQQKVMINLSWQEARTLCVNVFDTVSMPLYRVVNGVRISADSMMDLDNYIRNHVKEVDVIRQLVYHKKERKISLVGYNEFKIEG
ncbi:hypothetical protein [Aeromonas phage AS-zj]|uniref:Uncharacterized protein n=2 Tax=Ceceduovirus aszj TaxID=2843652 RepID=A0A411B868_9CAUD|nr:hypothetical protein HWB28_gp294 [Aeromonas phage AS-zj]ASU00258.1 hypothetical protein [Aeromonas phage AS-zj]QAX97780.1 hypothetical protein ASswx1_135 [Aeromonas phage Asswx_1]